MVGMGGRSRSSVWWWVDHDKDIRLASVDVNDPRLSLPTTAFLILLTLRRHHDRGARYGLQLAEDTGQLRQTTYWALNRLQQQGLVSSQLEKGAGPKGPRRRFYSLTEAGVAYADRVLELGVEPKPTTTT